MSITVSGRIVNCYIGLYIIAINIKTNAFPFFITNVMHSNVDSFGSTSAIEEGPSHFKYGSDLRLSSIFSTQS